MVHEERTGDAAAGIPPAPAPRLAHCNLCGLDFDESEDPYHRDACRDAARP